MSTQVQSLAIDVAGRALLIGGTWKLADSASDVKVIRAEIPRGSILFELLHTNDRSVVVYSRPLKLNRGAVSGGAIVTALAPDVFVCHQIDSATFWVFAAVNGHPLPGFDRIVRMSEVAQLLSDARLSGAEMTLVGDVPESEMSLAILLGGADAVAWNSTSITSRSPWMIPTVGVAACAVVLGGYFSWFATAEPTTPVVSSGVVSVPVVAAQAPHPAASEVPPEPEIPVRYSSRAATLGVMAAVRSLPASVNGWVPTSVICKMASSDCVATWTATPGAKPDGAESIPGVDLNVTSALGKQVQSHFNANLTANGRVQLIAEEDLLSFYSLGTSYLADPSDYTVTITPAAQQMPPGGMPMSRINASGPLWQWERLTGATSASSVTIEEVAIQQLASADPQLRLTGAAFVNPKTGAQVASR